MPSKTTPFCFVFQGKLYINTGNGKDFLGIQNEDSSQLCFLFVRRSVISMVCFFFFCFGLFGIFFPLEEVEDRVRFWFKMKISVFSSVD